ncbi:Smx2 [Kluyveromyces lactis]|nr:Smx2 [Kluyveromyces lactis]
MTSPDLRKYMDKKLILQLNGNRKIIGILRGYDAFLNVVLDNPIQIFEEGEVQMGPQTVVRGNSIVSIEPLDSL